MSQLFGHLSREFFREVGTKSREVFELILPPADVFEDGSDLVIMLDLPGFDKDKIKTRLTESSLSVTANRRWEEPTTVVRSDVNPDWRTRPSSRYSWLTTTSTLPGNGYCEKLTGPLSFGPSRMAISR